MLTFQCEQADGEQADGEQADGEQADGERADHDEAARMTATPSSCQELANSTETRSRDEATERTNDADRQKADNDQPFIGCIVAQHNHPRTTIRNWRPASTSNRDRGPSAADLRLVERAPRLIYAEDVDGNRVPLINVPLERIQQLLDGNLENNPRLQPPSYQVDRFEIKGRADSDRALLNVSLEITTLRLEDDKQERWISVPLRMHESSLLDSPDYQGDGQVFLTYDATDGYQAWIRHQSNGKHKISLQFATNLSRAALATQIRFFPPTANISKIVLDVPGERISADIENGKELTISPSAESRSTISANDLRNQVIIVWRDGIELPSPKMAYLDARGDIQVSIDGPGAIRSTVSLDVRSYSNDIEAFAIRLPPFTTIVSEGGQGYQISELNRPAPNADDTRRTVQVTLDNPSPEIQLQFATQTTGEAASNKENSDLANVANFEVIGALRQSGRVSLISSEDWLVYWYLVHRCAVSRPPKKRMTHKRESS